MNNLLNNCETCELFTLEGESCTHTAQEINKKAVVIKIDEHYVCRQWDSVSNCYRDSMLTTKELAETYAWQQNQFVD